MYTQMISHYEVLVVAHFTTVFLVIMSNTHNTSLQCLIKMHDRLASNSQMFEALSEIHYVDTLGIFLNLSSNYTL